MRYWNESFQPQLCVLNQFPLSSQKSTSNIFYCSWSFDQQSSKSWAQTKTVRHRSYLNRHWVPTRPREKSSSNTSRTDGLFWKWVHRSRARNGSAYSEDITTSTRSDWVLRLPICPAFVVRPSAVSAATLAAPTVGWCSPGSCCWHWWFWRLWVW